MTRVGLVPARLLLADGLGVGHDEIEDGLAGDEIPVDVRHIGLEQDGIAFGQCLRFVEAGCDLDHTLGHEEIFARPRCMRFRRLTMQRSYSQLVEFDLATAVERKTTGPRATSV